MLNHIPGVPDWVNGVALPVNRWLHIVAMATLVGGTLFYEFVIPLAVEDLKEETQLAVMGRVRWIFRRLVVFSVITLILTGIVSTWWTWPMYKGMYDPVRSWWASHLGVGVIAMAVVVRVTLGDRVPRHPIAWLRASFVVMLVAIFLASVARYVQLSVTDDAERYHVPMDSLDSMMGYRPGQGELGTGEPGAGMNGTDNRGDKPTTEPTTQPAGGPVEMK